MVVALATPVRGSAQLVTSFAELPLRINRDDHVRVVDQSGAKVTGRVVSFGRDGLSIATDGGERRFADESVRRVDRRGQSKARGALIGAGALLVVGLVGCPEDSAKGCPVFAALLWGAPMGTLVGAWVPSWHAVYRAPANRAPANARAARGDQVSLLEDLGMRVNLGDHLIVESATGVTTNGNLSRLADDAFALKTTDSESTQFTRETVRRVSVLARRTRLGTLLGFAAGSLLCLPGAGSDWVDAVVLCGGLGAGVGAIAGHTIHTSTVVYPDKAARISVSPAISRGGAGLRATLRF
jgi:hypothetical protein